MMMVRLQIPNPFARPGPKNRGHDNVPVWSACGVPDVDKTGTRKILERENRDLTPGTRQDSYRRQIRFTHISVRNHALQIRIPSDLETVGSRRLDRSINHYLLSIDACRARTEI